MHVLVTARHMELKDEMKQYATDKANKLTKYYNLIQEIEIVFDASNGQMSAEMIVNAEHKAEFIAKTSDENGDPHKCLDALMDKMERQLTDHKEMYRNRKHPPAKGSQA